MRPIRLELSAFGPYLEHTVIDFEKLNEAGLFLITGQTGGGKTTLLDAMSIALFYKSTGGRRTFQDMRCLAAADSDRTEVVYHFALGEDEYCFRRALYRRKKRGSDNFITEEENECKRRTADGWALAASGAARNVTGYAENLLSLTAEQFSQVIVLPQGKFMQLLRANSTEKAAILKTLFSCELWECIAMKFTERQKKLYAKRETCETKLKSLLEKHGAETAEALAVQTEALRLECARTEKALAAAKEALTLAQKQYTRALQFEQCQKAETDAEAQLKTAETRAASAKAQYTRAEQNRAGLTKLTAEKDTLLKRSEQLRAEQERSLQKEQLLKELRAEEERERAVQKQAEDDRQKLPEVLRRIAVGEAFTEKADAAKDRLASLLQTQTILSEQLAALKTRSDAAKAEAQCKKLWGAAEDAARTARLTVVGQDKLLSAAEAKWNQNSAAALATGLTDGTPCPVCGAATEVRVSPVSGVKTLRCTDANCPAKHLKRFVRFASKAGLDIDGLSVQTLHEFVNRGYLRDFADLYHLDAHADEIVKLEGFGEKSCANLLAAIEKSRKVDPIHLIFALCIPNIGADAGKKLIAALGTKGFLSRIESGEGFEDVDGIGVERSNALLNWFADDENKNLFDRLMAELTLEDVAPKQEADGTCKGLSFVITGDVHLFKNRSAFKAYVEQQGGAVTGSVSGKTTYLVSNDGESNSSKTKKAKELGVPILSEEEFVSRFGGPEAVGSSEEEQISML